MDEMVRAAMLKWPGVPSCSGWLGLDTGGEWYMRDAAAQAAGPFQQRCATMERPATAKGSRLQHEGLVAFIGRNYAADAQGRWYFQNGPQQVFVELAAAPWVLRLHPDGQVHTHTGHAIQNVAACLTDEHGHLYLETERGLGLVHSRDVHVAAEWVEVGRWNPESVTFDDLPTRYGYVLSPERALKQQSPG